MAHHGSAEGRSCSDSLPSTRRNPSQASGGWEYVYLKSSDDRKGRLVELQDSQDHCSEASTVLGPVGFVVPITLAVPTRLLPPDALPVIAGNTIELGDWDLKTADLMAPATGELQAPDYAFFSVTVCSNYSTVEEVFFRFAVVLGSGDDRRRWCSEIHCWEGQFVRRVADYIREGGVAFLVFGRPEPMSSTQELLDYLPSLPPAPPLCPGWLCDPGQAIIMLRLETALFDAPASAELPVEVRLFWDPPARLTANFRGPLVLGRSGATLSADAHGQTTSILRFPSPGDVRAQFLQLVPIDAAVSPVLHFRFGDTPGGSLEATVRLPPQLFPAPQSPPPMPPEEDLLVCDLRPLAASADSARVGQAVVRLRRLRYSQRCPPEVIRSLDRCGSATGPPPGPRPILIALMPPDGSLIINASASTTLSDSLDVNYVELPIGVSADGRLTSFASGGGAVATATLSAHSEPDSLMGVVVRVVRDPADPPEALEAGVDALLSLFILTEHWMMLVASDLRLCAVLCLKQARLPVAMAFNGGADMEETMTACRYYGVRAIVVPASALTAELLASAAARDLAVYAYGGGGVSTRDIKPELAANLEGVFLEGTFAACRFDAATAGMNVALPEFECPLTKRRFCSTFF